MDLFSRLEKPKPVVEHAAKVDPGTPLAERLRPRTIEEFIGQDHLLGEGKLLRQAIRSKQLPSLVLWGPPGTGKTTLARILAGAVGARFSALSAVTAGVKEVRAWTIHKGDTAPQAAGVIHTDFEKGFIRAEVISYDDFIAYNGEQGAKEAGKMRLEGKEYIVKDGDVMHFRFNV